MSNEIVWGGTTLPPHDAEKTQIEFIQTGHAYRVLSGELRFDRVNEKRRVTVLWSALSDTEYDTLRQAFLDKAYDSNLLSLPETISPDSNFNVIAGHHGMKSEITWGGKNNDVSSRFVTIIFDEV